MPLSSPPPPAPLLPLRRREEELPDLRLRPPLGLRHCQEDEGKPECGNAPVDPEEPLGAHQLLHGQVGVGGQEGAQAGEGHAQAVGDGANLGCGRNRRAVSYPSTTFL